MMPTHVEVSWPNGLVHVLHLLEYLRLPTGHLEGSVCRLIDRTEALRLRASLRQGRA
jgi:hypothetical protein